MNIQRLIYQMKKGLRHPGQVPRYLYRTTRYRYATATRNPLTTTADGLTLELDPADDVISKSLLLEGSIDAELESYFEDEVDEGVTVVDVGANIGYYTLLFSKFVGSTGNVIAIEPEPSNADRLRSNIQRNGASNVQVYETAVSDEKSNISLYIHPFNSGGHSIQEESVLPFSDKVDGGEEVTVPVTQFDELVDCSEIDLIKIDVEGAEGRVLRGMEQTLENSSPKMILEYSPDLAGDEFNHAIRWLSDLGYQLRSIDGGRKWLLKKYLNLTRDSTS